MDQADSAKPAYDGDKLAKEGNKWMERIRAAEKREDQWRKDAAAAEKAYAADGSAKGEGCLYDFNILHSNVETIVPAIYNSTPVPDVRRRWTEAIGDPPQDPTPQILQQAAQQAGLSPEQAQQAAQTPQGQQLAQQALAQPQARQAVQQFQQEMQAWQGKAQRDKDTKALGDMIERAIIVQIDDNRLDKEIEADAQDAFLAGRGVVRLKFEATFGDTGGVSDEHLEFEAVSWRDFRMGPATRWENVPWEAFRHVVARETLEGYSDKELVSAQPQTEFDRSPGNEDDDVVFWEVWCKATREVKFIREDDGKILKITPDPLGLKGFFPNPEPVQPIGLTGKMTPVCPFTIYRKLADELDLATKRINKIMKGLKMRGLLAGNAAKLLEIATLDDNELQVLDDLEVLAQTGIDKAVLWWPVEQAIKVLQQLYEQREQIKQAIYEITGISDIIRGASQASETATAQQIKTQWGSLRIQKMQRLIERQVRDLFGMMAEIIVSGKFSDQTLYAMTAIEVTDGMRALIKQPVLTSYRVDVESDSTVRADLTRVKGEMGEFLTGTANFFGTMAQPLQAQPKLAKPIAEIYASFARVFKLGKQAEDALDQMVQIAKEAPDQQPPNPEQIKAEADAKAREQDAAMKERQMQLAEAADQRSATAEAAAQEREAAHKERLAAIEIQKAEKELEIKTIDLELKRAEAAIRLSTKAQEPDIAIAAKQARAAQQPAGTAPQ
jgi:hypothetical protein